MTFQPAHRNLPVPQFIGPWSWCGLGPKLRGASATAPSSGTWFAANQAIFQPIALARQYDLQRFWWQNGATVGTDTLHAAIYRMESASTLHCIASSQRLLSAGTANHLQYATVAVNAHLITTGTSTTDGTTFETASVNLKARPGLMYALIFNNSKASAADAASSVETTTGGTISFTSRTSQTYGASTEGRVSMWTAVPSADVTDTITMTFPATQTGAAWALVAFTNVDTATNHGIVQVADDAGSSTTPTATLAAFSSTNNATIGANANLADTTTTPGTGFTELADINYTTPTNCLQVQFRHDNDTSSDGTITAGQWGAIAAEIKSLGTTLKLAPGTYYLGLVCTGTTATVFRVSTVTQAAHTGIHLQAALTTGLPLVPTLAPSTTGVFNFGITNRASP